MRPRQNLQKTKNLAIMSLLTALLIVLSMTPLGYLNIGPLAITLNVIPVAIAGIALGPTGGAILGAVFGVTSYLQAMGIGGASAMGLICFEISPFLTFVHRVLSRILAGYLTGWVFRLLGKRLHIAASSAITGFAAAFLNTLFFMTSLLLCFGHTEYVRGLIGGQNVLLFVCTYVGVNAVFEMIAGAVASCALGSALYRAKLIHTKNSARKG
ncbi:MAG: ECF transporter S component [Clostridia bacterium]|nr:ECF transporter S component [Clostridia bacterium]